MCSGGVRSILLFPLVARCLETIDVCIWRMFLYVCCSDSVGGGGLWEICCVAANVKDSGFLSDGVLKCVVFIFVQGMWWMCVFCLYCEAWCCRNSCMTSVSVLSCRCCMLVACVHPMAVVNAAFCMTCTFFKDARGDHMEEAYPRTCRMTTL